MNCSVVFDWKLAVALGSAVVAVIFAAKMNATDAKEVSIKVIDACKEYAVAITGNC